MTEQQERALRDGLKALAAQASHLRASARVEAAVMAEMERHPRGAGNHRDYDALSNRFAALAAALLAGVGLAIWSMPARTPVESVQFIRPSGFVELPQASVLPEMESASIVRVSLPASALPQYGVSIVPEMPAVAIEAELLVAQDGQPRAIRLVRDRNQLRSSP